MRVAKDISVHPSKKQLAKMQDLTDMRFGRLVAKEYVGLGNWRCVCDCGKETIARNHALLNGIRVSCGCYQKEMLSKSRVDRTGVRYGRLVALRQVEGTKWLCRCDCGNEIVVDGRNLTMGGTQSCGCLKLERTSECHRTHGKSKERLYKVWKGMRRRCYGVNEPAYANYGGRGISICDEWRNDYTKFREWALENGYDPDAQYGKCTIDRIDVNGNYEPSNCRFITLGEQARNTRCCRPVEFLDKDGNVIASYGSVAEAVEGTGISSASIYRTCAGKQSETHGMIVRYKK